MSRCRVLFDECIAYGLAHGLRLRVPTASILQVGDFDTPPKSADDAELLIWCEEQRRLFVSVDRVTMPGFISAHHAVGRHTFGVFILKRGIHFADVLDDLQLIVEASEAEEWIDRFAYLPMNLW